MAKKNGNYKHKVLIEIGDINQKKKSVAMRATFFTEQGDVIFEGCLNEVSRTKKLELPVEYSLEFDESNNKPWYWVYASTPKSKIKGCFISKRKFAKANDAKRDAILHNTNPSKYPKELLKKS